MDAVRNYCIKCQTVNENDARYCKSCGRGLRGALNAKYGANWQDVLISIALVIMLIQALYWVFIPMLNFDWYSDFKMISVLINSLGGVVVPVFIALAVRQLTLRIVMIVIAVIMGLVSLYSAVQLFFLSF